MMTNITRTTTTTTLVVLILLFLFDNGNHSSYHHHHRFVYSFHALSVSNNHHNTVTVPNSNNRYHHHRCRPSWFLQRPTIQQDCSFLIQQQQQQQRTQCNSKRYLHMNNINDNSNEKDTSNRSSQRFSKSSLLKKVSLSSTRPTTPFAPLSMIKENNAKKGDKVVSEFTVQDNDGELDDDNDDEYYDETDIEFDITDVADDDDNDDSVMEIIYDDDFDDDDVEDEDEGGDSSLPFAATTGTTTIATTSTFNVPLKDDDDDIPVRNNSTIQKNRDKQQQQQKKKVQYVALEPGTVVQIEVGDITLGRKAWKKRRRTNSPLLIPCSIVHINIINAIRWNCIYLLEKFGTTTTTSITATSSPTSISSSSSSSSRMLRISIIELSNRYRTHLKSSLQQYAIQFGYESTYDFLVNNIFHTSIQDAYGIQVITTTSSSDNGSSTIAADGDNNQQSQQQQQQFLWLETPLSRQRAHRRAASAAILQFTEHDSNGDHNSSLEAATSLSLTNVGGFSGSGGGSGTSSSTILDHTGYVRIKKQRNNKTTTSNSEDTENNPKPNLYSIVPLSVALRVSANDIYDNIVYTGSRHAAVVFDYNCQTMINNNNIDDDSRSSNDNNDSNDTDGLVAPFITLSLNPQRNNVRERFKSKSNSNNANIRQSQRRKGIEDQQQLWFHQLKIGDGPFIGKVVRLIKGGAIVDCNIHRHRTKSASLSRNIVGNNNSDNENLSNSNNKAKAPFNIAENDSIPVLGVLRFKDAVLVDSSSNSVLADTLSSTYIDDEFDETDDDDDDDNYDDLLSIDDLNNFDDMDDELDDEDDDEDNMSNELIDENEAMESDGNMDTDTDDDEGEVLAAFNMENDDEFAEGEDITHLFNIRDDGTLEYIDPVTGETKIIADVNIQDDHDDDDDTEGDIDDNNDENIEYDDDDDDGPILLTPFDSKKSDGKSINDLKSSSLQHSYKTKTLRVGDTVELYVKSVSKQSNQLFLSMDPSLQGMNAKDMKKESDKQKKLKRLLNQVGGYQGLRELNGTICNGTIKATSNTDRSWCYVQPDLVNIPVGVATISNEVLLADRNDVGSSDPSTISDDDFKVGDTVRIRINGIDEDRGQLSMSIIGKYVTIV